MTQLGKRDLKLNGVTLRFLPTASCCEIGWFQRPVCKKMSVKEQLAVFSCEAKGSLVTHNLVLVLLPLFPHYSYSGIAPHKAFLGSVF